MVEIGSKFGRQSLVKSKQRMKWISPNCPVKERLAPLTPRILFYLGDNTRKYFQRQVQVPWGNVFLALWRASSSMFPTISDSDSSCALKKQLNVPNAISTRGLARSGLNTLGFWEGRRCCICLKLISPPTRLREYSSFPSGPNHRLYTGIF